MSTVDGGDRINPPIKPILDALQGNRESLSEAPRNEPTRSTDAVEPDAIRAITRDANQPQDLTRNTDIPAMEGAQAEAVRTQLSEKEVTLRKKIRAGDRSKETLNTYFDIIGEGAALDLGRAMATLQDEDLPRDVRNRIINNIGSYYKDLRAQNGDPFARSEILGQEATGVLALVDTSDPDEVRSTVANLYLAAIQVLQNETGPTQASTTSGTQ
jgi:hypothetical protein